MLWSVSKSKIFAQCQRKWFYLEIVASHHAKSGIRKDAYHLKQLQSIYAWRGALVDTVIEKLIVPRLLYNKSLPSEQEAYDYAMQIADSQLEFAKSIGHKDPEITKTKAGLKYCALYDYEYNGGLVDSQVQSAKEEIKTALSNLLNSPLLKEIIDESAYMIAQRPLRFNFGGANVVCVPDLIVFYQDKPPMIIDWKVHVFGTTDYWLQLGIYALALSRTSPHKDYVRFQDKIADPKTFRLVEFQLLKNNLKSYKTSEQDVLELEDYIFDSNHLMLTVTNGSKYPELSDDDFQTAFYPEVCARCQFKKICWEDYQNEST